MIRIAFAAVALAAFAAPAHADPTCWDENKHGTVYRHCEAPDHPPPPRNGPAVRKDRPPPTAQMPPGAPPPGAPHPTGGYIPTTSPYWRSPPVVLGPFDGPPPLYGPGPSYLAPPPLPFFVPPPVYIEPPPVYIEPPPVYVEPPVYYAPPLPCTPKLSPYGGLGDGPFCQIIGDPWAW